MLLLTANDALFIKRLVILQMNLRESHWLFRRVYGFIYTAAAVYMARVTPRKLHYDVMKTPGLFLSPQAKFSEGIFYMIITNFCEKQLVLNDAILIV